MSAQVRMLLYAWLLACGGAPAALGQSAFPIQAGGRIFDAPDVDALLARPYTANVPMACVGECLWAAHPEGWAFASGAHYYLLTERGIGFGLELHASDRSVGPVEGTAYPSHVRQSSRIDQLKVDGWKWITRDDVLVARIRLTNEGQKPVQVLAKLTLPAPAVEEKGDDHFAWTTDVSGLQVYSLGRAEGFQPEQPQAAQGGRFWVEAEAATKLEGGTVEKKKAAGGGAVLGGGFGAREGTAVWTIPVAEAMDDAAISVRYARMNPGPAVYQIEVGDGHVLDRCEFPPTGGWGDRENQYRVATFPVGALAAGVQRVSIRAAAPGSEISADLIMLHHAGAPFQLPQPTVQTRLATIEAPARHELYVNVFVAAATRPEKAEQALARVAAMDDPLRDQQDALALWLRDNVPGFHCEQEMLERLYWHRATSVVHKNLFKLGEGRLTRWAMAEGRWNSTWYPNAISYGAGHHIRETRWLRDPVYVRDIVSTWCENERENGLFPTHIPAAGPVQGQYADWIPSAAWDAYCVQPDLETLRNWAPALKRNVDGWLAQYDPDNDGLLLVDNHGWTGMEWQPSFFFFQGYDKDRAGQALERVDLTAYVYGSARALAAMLRTLGDDAESARYEDAAKRIRDAVATILWDGSTRYFYSVEPEKHEKALVKEIVGVYPFYFGMFDAAMEPEYAEAWRSVINPAEFWTAWPVASASRQCPAYSQDERFKGKSIGGCMWNGPTWPHANSLVLSAMAQSLRQRRDGPLDLEHFHSLLVSYTNAQFLNQDVKTPWTGEYYNGDTGAWRTEERDYNHSTYLDILIGDLAGLRPRADDVLELAPLLTDHTPGFVIDGIRYHGHDLTVAWTRVRGPGPGPDGRTGLRVYADGALIFSSEGRPAPRRILRDMATGFAPIAATE